MKLKLTQAFPAGCLALMMLVQSYVSAAAPAGGDDRGDKEKKEVKRNAKVSASRNNSSVKIYPDILKRVMHVVARDGSESMGIDFFVFSSDGTIVHHYKMKSGDHEKMVSLARGRYIFRVFAGDEETATGGFEVR